MTKVSRDESNSIRHPIEPLGLEPRVGLSTPFHKYGNVCRWGLRGEIKAGGGRRCLAIFDDDQRRDRPQPPTALRVATGRADFFVAPPLRHKASSSSSLRELDPSRSP